MPVHIIMLSGPQGSGKSSLALEIESQYKEFKYQHIRTIKFADPLYKLQNFCLNFMANAIGTVPEKKDGELMQLLGDWAMSRFGLHVFSRIARKTVDEYIKLAMPESLCLVVIEDCRMEHEFDAFPEAYRVRLNAPEEIRKARTTSWRENTSHRSEVGLNNYEAEGKFDDLFFTDNPQITPKILASAILKKSVGENAKIN